LDCFGPFGDVTETSRPFIKNVRKVVENVHEIFRIFPGPVAYALQDFGIIQANQLHRSASKQASMVKSQLLHDFCENHLFPNAARRCDLHLWLQAVDREIGRHLCSTA